MREVADPIASGSCPAPPEEPLLLVRDLAFAWPGGAPVLDVSELAVGPGERVFLRGASGSGKSTLLGLVCGVLVPDQGEVRIARTVVSALGPARRDAFRAAHLGVIFQLFNLLPYLSLVDNVTLPCRFSTERAARLRQAGTDPATEAARLLDRLGLADARAEGRPVAELSVGQQQRVAAARALIGRPVLVIADEPTSALDEEARDAFLELLLEECAGSGAGLLFVSHDARLAPRFDRPLELTGVNRATGASGRTVS